MSLHKLTAGSGYEYLTRQVAALDATDKGRVGLASYYAERGESPGTWMGSGLAGIDGLDRGDPVTADQMKALFGHGHHPLATRREAMLDAVGTGPARTRAEVLAQRRDATRLGSPFRVVSPDVSDFRVEVAHRIRALNRDAGLPEDWPVPAHDRARIRTELATEMFRTEHGREPVDARELSAVIAKHTRSRTTAIAGFDLTFSPVKSVSTLWALAAPHTAAAIERAHLAAVEDAIEFLEQNALYTRLGRNGVRQVDVRGLVATAFTHRDSRAGDPDLHSHLAVANKVQTQDGRWRAIDGRTLYAAAVAASETYNTALERHLSDLLGLSFAPRAPTGPGKRPVREIVGVDPRLNDRFSKRRRRVESRRDELTAAFQATHGRPPSPVETLHLAQQATLETRESKHEPRSQQAQREAWNAEAADVLGSPAAVHTMVKRALHPCAPQAARTVTALDVETMAHAALTAVQGTRATWRHWHLVAESQRQVRAHPTTSHLDAPTAHRLVAEVTRVALAHSVPLERPGDEESTTPTDHNVPAPRPAPGPLIRKDGSSVYEVAGARLFTSHDVLAAEERLVNAAALTGGHVVPGELVDAVIRSHLQFDHRATLNSGQRLLVHEMATSGARLQLAVAPAGAGKTTAMHALAQAWRSSGGAVIGLAPSAAAADALGSALGAHAGTPGAPPADTLSKLVHSLTAYVDQTNGGRVTDPNVDARTLVIIDEAGMADTLTLDAAVTFLLGRGASVRLIGDDQQLAAVGAGGVLRDIATQHGALQLSELVRFTDPAEAAASLAVREGRTEALGFYLDHGRIHVGDRSTTVDDAFAAWRSDRLDGTDSLMLAPTRDLVAELNRRARQDRLETNPAQTTRRTTLTPGGDDTTTVLGDDNHVSAGDTVITRKNDRRLRSSAHDWVKNGDRWLVTAVTADGGLTVRHLRHGRTAVLPPSYVRTSTGLGYACTVHTAQGVTADRTHGIATGAETRQLLYTMLTRGRHHNHVYLQVAGDGDPHEVIRPVMSQPPTAVDLLTTILARDGAQTSATTARRDAADPRRRLGAAAARHHDVVHVAAEDLAKRRLGGDWADRLETAAEHLLPKLCDAAAWPTLRSHLALLSSDGSSPVAHLAAALRRGRVDDAHDPAALLTWRLAAPSRGAGLLPWFDATPPELLRDGVWGPYLREQSEHLEALIDDAQTAIRQDATKNPRPHWAHDGVRVDPDLRIDVELWRAAMDVDPHDRRPTGQVQHDPRAAGWQRRLDRQLAGHLEGAMLEWNHLLHQGGSSVIGDTFTPVLAQRLATIARTGLTVHDVVRRAIGERDLPDEHGAAALWWRMTHHLAPAVADRGDLTAGASLRPHDWDGELASLLDPETLTQVRQSPWWPALRANLDQCHARGWRLDDLLGQSRGTVTADNGGDPCEALVWRTSIVLDPISSDDDFEPPPEPDGLDAPPDLWRDDVNGALHGSLTPEHDADTLNAADRVIARLTLAGWSKDADLAAWRPAPPSEDEIRRGHLWAQEWDRCPVSPERMLAINQLALTYYESRFHGSWARNYLSDRMRMDLGGDERFRPGYAPSGWTNLVEHLRRCGVSDDEMLLTGVAARTADQRLIDRFRDRLLLPIFDPSNPVSVLGFVGRRRPDYDAPHGPGHLRARTGGLPHAAGRWVPPKYLNSPTTPLFHKDAQLYGAHLWGTANADSWSSPTLVEGPLDAMAVTVASADRYLGVAPLGTALTQPQAHQFAAMAHEAGAEARIATDPDAAGTEAAQRTFWLLSDRGVVPHLVGGTEMDDPAGVLTRHGPARLVASLDQAPPAHQALFELWAPDNDRHQDCLDLLARAPSAKWEPGLACLAAVSGRPLEHLRRDLLTTVEGVVDGVVNGAVERGTRSSPRRDVGAGRNRLDRPSSPRTLHDGHNATSQPGLMGRVGREVAADRTRPPPER